MYAIRSYYAALFRWLFLASTRVLIEFVLAVSVKTASLKSASEDVTLTVKSSNVPLTSLIPRCVTVKNSCECGASFVQTVGLLVVKAERLITATIDSNKLIFFIVVIFNIE